MVKYTLTEMELTDLIREDYENNKFSFEGAQEIAGDLINLENELNTEFEFDIVNIRMAYNEYDNIKNIENDLQLTKKRIEEEYDLINLENGGIIIKEEV